MKDHSQPKDGKREKKKDGSTSKLKKKSTPDPKQRDLISLFAKSSKVTPKSIEIIDSDSDADEPLSNLKGTSSLKGSSSSSKDKPRVSSPTSPVLYKKFPKEKYKSSGAHGEGTKDPSSEKGHRHALALGCLKELSSCKVLVNGIGSLLPKKSPVSPKGPKSPVLPSKKGQKVVSPTTSPNEKTKTSPPSLVISPKRITEKDSTAAADIFSWKIPRKRKSDESLSPDGPPVSPSKGTSLAPAKKEPKVTQLSQSSNKIKKQKLSDDSKAEKSSEKHSKKKHDKKGESKSSKSHSQSASNTPNTKSPSQSKDSKKKSSSTGKKSDSGKIKKKTTPSKINVARSIIFSSDDSEADMPLSKLKVLSPKVKNTERKSEKSPKIKVTKKVSKAPLKQKSLLDFAKGNDVKTKNTSVSLHDRFAKVSTSSKKDLKAEKKSLKKPLTEEEKKERQKQRMLAKRELNKKVDDHELGDALALPAPTTVPLPKDVNMEAFGDILMITEFLSTFHKLMMPEDNSVITAEELSKALGSGKEGFQIVSKVLLVFLRILCAEEDAEIEGLKVSIADMPLTIYTVSELLRYYLEVRENEKTKENTTEKTDTPKVEVSQSGEALESKTETTADDTSSISSGETEDTINRSELPQRIVKQLKLEEFFTLAAADQLKILVYLFNQVLDSAEFSEHLVSLQIQSKDALREQDLLRKKKAKERKEQMAKVEETKAKEETSKVGALDKFVTKGETNESKTTDEVINDTVKAPKEEEEVKQEQDLKSEENEGKVEVKEETEDTKPEEKQELEDKNESTTKTAVTEVANGPEPEKGTTKVKGKTQLKEEEVTCDLVMVVKQRRLLAAQQLAMKEEIEKKDKERRAKLEEEYQQQKKIQGWKDALDRCKKAMRLDSIGSDRDYKLYWILSGGSPYLYVEDGWMYHESEHKQINSWGYYSTVEEINDLLKALCERGIREHSLKTALLSHYTTLTNRMKRKHADQQEPSPRNENDTLTAFHADIIESATRSVKGNLGNMPDLQAWQEKVQQTTNMEELASFVLELQGSIYPKNFQGFLNLSAGSTGQTEFWRKAVEGAKTMSALHLLLGLLENSISWDRSAENAKCKVCRRKGDDMLVLCDICNCAYHGYCLRPALDYLTPDGWQCPACMPTIKRQRRCARQEIKDDEGESEVEEEEDDDDESGDESNEEEDEESGSEEGSDHESYCHVCAEGGEVICCDTCPLVFHLECHDPPLRRLPRGTWNCCVCRNPKRSTRNQAQAKGKQGKTMPKQKRKPGRRRVVYQSSADDNDSSESDDENDEETTTKISRTRRKRKANEKEVSEQSDSESDVEEEDDTPRTRRGGKKQQNTTVSRGKRAKQVVSKVEKENQPSNGNKVSGRKRRAHQTGSSEDTPLQATTQGRKRRKEMEAENTNTTPTENKDLGSKRRDSISGRHRRGNNYEITACENIMAKLWGNDCAWAFKAPVNLKQIPDYLSYVETPMDLWTIKEKLNKLEYEDAFQFIEDVRLVLRNSRSYNADTSEVGKSWHQTGGLFPGTLNNVPSRNCIYS